MASLSDQQVQAAQEFVDATIDVLRAEKGVHAETAVAAAARMAGTFLFRSFGFRLEGVEAGQPVFSDQADEQGPVLVQILQSVLSQAGVALETDRPAQAPGAGNRPLLAFLDTQRRLEPRFLTIKDRLGLSLREAAESAAVAAAFLIHQSAQVLDPKIAYGVAVYGFVEGTKTAPGPVTRQ